MESEFPSGWRLILWRINELLCNTKQPSIPLPSLKRSSRQGSDSRPWLGWSVTFKTSDKTAFMIFGRVFDADVKAMIHRDLWSFLLHQNSKTRCATRYAISFDGKPLFTVLTLNGLTGPKRVHDTRILMASACS